MHQQAAEEDNPVRQGSAVALAPFENKSAHAEKNAPPGAPTPDNYYSPPNRNHINQGGRHVYLIQSEKNPERRYVGLTENLRRRVAQHNSQESWHTSPWTPWRLVAAIWFAEPDKAEAFENYLKSGSGRAFAARRLW